MDSSQRKSFKLAGRRVFHRNYLFLVFLCLILSLFGTEGNLSVMILEVKDSGAFENITEQEPTSILDSQDVFQDIVNGDLGKSIQTSDQILQNIRETESGNEILGRTNGVLAGLVNAVASGKLYVDLAMRLRSLTETDQGAALLFMVLDLLRTVLIWIFIRNIYCGIIRRLFLELRIYDKIPFTDALHFAEVRRWFKASWTLFVKEVFYFLWSLTIVGAVIKYYSYYAVPYIVAENPGIGTLEAITLSRRMMNGHKKEAFLFDLSYIGWYLLMLVTLGLSDLFYGLPYRMAGRSEYYCYLRSLAIRNQIPLSEKLDDRYLYEKADKILLYETYFDVVDRQAYLLENKVELSPKSQFVSRWFGIWLGTLKKKKQYEELEGIKYQMHNDRNRRDGRAYPKRLNPRYKASGIRLKMPFTFLRSYSVWTLMLLFILFSSVGWIWEVSLHLMQGEGFINRGMLHGPWIPIYGAGGIIALMLCTRFRKNPVKEFFFSVLLCGCIEYLGAYILETRYHEKWWSYEGNFLNLHGRICAEGLLVFGVACMLVVYLIAPLFDYFLSMMKNRVLCMIAVSLMAVFVVDAAYSSVNPNMVKGAIVAHDQETDSVPPDGQSSSETGAEENAA